MRRLGFERGILQRDDTSISSILGYMISRRNERTEEIVQICAEVCDVAVSTDERKDFPVSIGAFPEVPGVSSNVETAEDLRANRLNAIMNMKGSSKEQIG